jgi:G3E family GTPase
LGERVGVRGDVLNVKLVSISGTNGSGKTTLTRELISRLGKGGKRSAVIVNEDGVVDYDPEFVQVNHLWVTYLRGG